MWFMQNYYRIIEFMNLYFSLQLLRRKPCTQLFCPAVSSVHDKFQIFMYIWQHEIGIIHFIYFIHHTTTLHSIYLLFLWLSFEADELLVSFTYDSICICTECFIPFSIKFNSNIHTVILFVQ